MDRWMGNSNFAEIFRVDDGWMDGWIVCVCVWMYLGSWGVGSAKEMKLMRRNTEAMQATAGVEGGFLESSVMLGLYVFWVWIWVWIFRV